MFLLRCLPFRTVAALLLWVAVLPFANGAGQASAQSFWDRTHLVSVTDESSLSNLARNAGAIGVTRSDGSTMQIGHWYESDWRDLSALWMTEVTENFGIYWGLSTGEQGEKYRIDPSMKVGFILNRPISRHSLLTLSSTYTIGGNLNEDTCVADYGPVFGSYTVNCRLASSFLSPEDTLDQMLDRRPTNHFMVNLNYKFSF